MVVLIILAAAMSVGIVFGTMNSGKNSTKTGTENNNQNSCKYFFFLFFN